MPELKNNVTAIPKTATLPISKTERLNAVNKIMFEISGRSRRFFYNKDTDTVAALFFRHHRLYYKCEWGKKDAICISGIAEYNSFKGWYHGGGLRSLVKAFREYVLTGIKQSRHWFTDHNYWGYPAGDLHHIENLAVKLGFCEATISGPAKDDTL